MPSVSVIIPNYNHAPYLRQRIDSVLNQTYTDLEVIILDDCSIDNSREIIEQYRSNEKVRHIVYNTENSGSTFKQWDKGINMAQGEYIWIAESDDWCENNLLETIIAGLEKREDTVFGYCQSFCIENNGNIIFQSRHNKLEDYSDKTEFIEEFLTFGNAVFNASMAVFKRDYYYKISSTYKSFKFTGDWIFWAELSRLGDVFISAKPLNYFRKHNNDVSSKMYASGQNFIEEIAALNYLHTQLGMSDGLYFRAKIKLYNRFMSGRIKMERAVLNHVKELLFEKDSFIQKQYFLLATHLYGLKISLGSRINFPLGTTKK